MDRRFSTTSPPPAPLVASPATGYKFVNWTGDVPITITNVNDPTTSITMSGDYAITAKFLDPKKETLATANNQSLDLTLLPGH